MTLNIYSRNPNPLNPQIISENENSVAVERDMILRIA